MPQGKGRYAGRWRVAIGLLVALDASEVCSQPSPPRRPPELGRIDSAGPREGDEDDAWACMARLADLRVEFHAATTPSSDEACTIRTPIRLERLLVSLDGADAAIEFPARPLIDCRLAEPLALWIGGVAAPVFAVSFSSALKAVRTGSGFECRNRNREANGKISAHATGFALDISGFELSNRRFLSFGSSGSRAAQAALQTVRTAACGWFTTVLGPGSDSAHDDHLHVDIQRHGASDRYRICE